MEINCVQLSIAEYNRLLLENAKLKGAIKIFKESWKGAIDVKLDVDAVRDIIVEKFNTSDYASTHRLVAADKMFNPSVTIAEPTPIETEEPIATEE